MAENLLLDTAGANAGTLDLDLRDEDSFLASDRAEYDVDGIRALLAAINLQPVGRPTTEPRDTDLMDLAVFRATGSHRLAQIFGSYR